MKKQVDLWLTHDQKLLLQAALLSNEVALTSWQEWKATVDIDILDHESYRLLPLLYQNLSSLGILEVDMGRLKGVYRRTWSENQLLFPDICEIIKCFDENEIKIVLLKDAALNLGYYLDCGVKMISAIDFLVAPIDAIKAINLLQKIGWIAQREIPNQNFQYSHILGFKNKSRQYLNLRWRLFGDGFPKEADQDFWDSIVLIDVGGVNIPVLSPTNQLLYSCAESIPGQSNFPFSHFADLAMIINSVGDKIDWKQLIRQAQKYRLTLPIKNRLIQLNEILSIQLPILQELKNLEASRMEHKEYQIKNSSQNTLSTRFLMRYFQYLKISNSDNFIFNFWGLLNYFKYVWNLENLWEFPKQAILRSAVTQRKIMELKTNHSSIVTQPEIEVLLLCARTQMNPAQVERLKVLLQQKLNWEELLEMAKQHKVMPLLYSNLKNHCPDSVPKAILTKLKFQFQMNAQHSLLLSGELVKLLNLFEANKIPFLPFKGPVLAVSAYGNLLLRQFTDLDILVRSQDIEKAKQLFLAQGYQMKIERIEVTEKQREIFVQSKSIHKLVRESAYPFIYPSNGLVVELHWGIMPKYFAFPIDSEALWQDGELVTIAGTEISHLSPENSLLMLVGHGTKDCWTQLARICDVAEHIHRHPQLNWAKLMQQARAKGGQRMLFLALTLAQNLLGISLPEEIGQNIQSDPAVPLLAQKVSQNLFQKTDGLFQDGSVTHFHLSARERLQDKLLYFIRLSMTPTTSDWLLLPWAEFSVFLYYLLRPIRLGGRQVVKKLARKNE